MLEAKDQGHNRKCSPKEKKNFFGRPPKNKRKGLQKIFCLCKSYVAGAFMFKPMPMILQSWSLVLICFGTEVWPKTGLPNKRFSLAARKPKLYCSLTNGIQIWVVLLMKGTKLELSKKARLLGVTLDSKITWKPHFTRITRKATTALMQCRQIVVARWRINPFMMK